MSKLRPTTNEGAEPVITLERVQSQVGSDAEQSVTARAVVPSHREVEQGHRTYVFTPPPPPEPSVPIGRRARAGVVRYFRDMDPRVIARGGSLGAVLAFALIDLIIQFDSSGWVVMLPDLRDVFNVDITVAFTLVAFGTVAGYLVAPFMGFMADRMNRIWSTRIGALLQFGLGGILAGAFVNLGSFVAGRFSGPLIGATLIQPTRAPLMNDLFRPSVLARALALVGVAAAVGPTAAPPLH